MVLDGDAAPSAPAGIPTCLHAASVTAPAGTFLRVRPCSSLDLIRFLITSDAGHRFFFCPWVRCGFSSSTAAHGADKQRGLRVALASRQQQGTRFMCRAVRRASRAHRGSQEWKRHAKGRHGSAYWCWRLCYFQRTAGEPGSPAAPRHVHAPKITRCAKAQD